MRTHTFSKSKPIGLLLLLSGQLLSLRKGSFRTVSHPLLSTNNEPAQRNYAKRPPTASSVRSYQQVVPYNQGHP